MVDSPTSKSHRERTTTVACLEEGHRRTVSVVEASLGAEQVEEEVKAAGKEVEKEAEKEAAKAKEKVATSVPSKIMKSGWRGMEKMKKDG